MSLRCELAFLFQPVDFALASEAAIVVWISIVGQSDCISWYSDWLFFKKTHRNWDGRVLAIWLCLQCQSIGTASREMDGQTLQPFDRTISRTFFIAKIHFHFILTLLLGQQFVRYVAFTNCRGNRRTIKRKISQCGVKENKGRRPVWIM
jgi:hypothetical protein